MGKALLDLDLLDFGSGFWPTVYLSRITIMGDCLSPSAELPSIGAASLQLTMQIQLSAARYFDDHCDGAHLPSSNGNTMWYAIGGMTILCSQTMGNSAVHEAL